MFRKVCFICIVCIAYLQFTAVTHHSHYSFYSTYEFAGNSKTSSVIESIPHLSDVYWEEEDDDERFFIEKKWSKPQSNIFYSFLQTIPYNRLVLLNSNVILGFQNIPLYLSLGNLRI